MVKYSGSYHDEVFNSILCCLKNVTAVLLLQSWRECHAERNNHTTSQSPKVAAFIWYNCALSVTYCDVAVLIMVFVFLQKCHVFSHFYRCVTLVNVSRTQVKTPSNDRFSPVQSGSFPECHKPNLHLSCFKNRRNRSLRNWSWRHEGTNESEGKEVSKCCFYSFR